MSRLEWAGVSWFTDRFTSLGDYALPVCVGLYFGLVWDGMRVVLV